jgi:predicted neuraminidase
VPESHAVAGPRAQRLLLLGLLLVAFAAGFQRTLRRPPAALFQPSSVVETGNEEPRFQSRFVSTTRETQAHAPAVVELRNGHLRAFWYAGSREGAEDVEVRTAVLDPDRGLWSEEKRVADRESTGRSLLRFVKKVGNPAVGRAADGTLSLFYVTVSVGGWAGSSITVINSRDDGETWSPPRRLITSPFFNLSTLVRSAPFFYADGTMGLPVYHELIGEFSELLRVDGAGRVMDKQRLSSGADTLQPVVLVISEREALTLMRYSGSQRPHRVVTVTTRDGGVHWTRPTKSLLSNPNAGLSGVVLPDGRILAVVNNIEDGREALSLVVSADGGATWRTAHHLEDESVVQDMPDDATYLTTIEGLARDSDPTVTDAAAYAHSVKRNMCWESRCHFEFSYPSIIETRRGDFHVVYDWNRSFIKHVEFNTAWLDHRLAHAIDAPLH